MNNLHGIIFSYEKVTELRDLVTLRTQGSIPFAGDYRLIDFVLSNMVNAGVKDVGVIMHGKCQSLMDHLGNGKSWDLSRKFGGLKMLPAFAYHENTDLPNLNFRGKVEALGNMMDYLLHIRQDYVVLSDAETVCNIDLEAVLRQHIASGSDMTVVCTKQPGRAADTHCKVDAQGRIVDAYFDIENPKDYRCINIFVVNTKTLIQWVEACMAHGKYSFKKDILQAMLKEKTFSVYEFEGCVYRIDTIQQYFACSMALLDSKVRADLFNPEHPIYGKENDASSTFLSPDGGCVNSLISDGCDIQGTVKNCIISRGVHIEKGAVVENCILFKETTVKSGCNLRCVIADKNVVFNEGRTLVGHEKYPIVLMKGAVV